MTENEQRQLKELKASLASIKGMSFLSTARTEIKASIKKLEAKIKEKN